MESEGSRRSATLVECEGRTPSLPPSGRHGLEMKFVDWHHHEKIQSHYQTTRWNRKEYVEGGHLLGECERGPRESECQGRRAIQVRYGGSDEGEASE
jgi:hypothetical protein